MAPSCELLIDGILFGLKWYSVVDWVGPTSGDIDVVAYFHIEGFAVGEGWLSRRCFLVGIFIFVPLDL
jgi:hypothetical protein